MRFSGTQSIFPCKEHEDVAVPIQSLIGADGALDIYPEVSGKGYFDIDYRKGQLSLRSKGFVGLIPISDTVAIHVVPRAPIGNLLYMIWRAGDRLASIEGFVRGYQETPGAVENAEELYVATLLSALREMKSRGVLKKYCAAETNEKRGRLLLGQTVSRFHSRGLRHRHVFEVHDLTANNAENQILKHTTERLLRHFSDDLAGENRKVANDLREIVSLFDGVDCVGITRQTVARQAARLIRGLPRSHRFYEPAIWLGYLIALKAGVVMEQVGRARFESVILDVSDVFERYIRRLLQEAATTHFGGCRVLDGNKKQVPLFTTTDLFNTQPDYYFRRGGQDIALADAKYKLKLATEDRYALIAFCEALGVHKAAFVCPRFPGEPLVDHQGTTRGGIQIHVIRIDLVATDLSIEEERFKKQIADSLSLPTAID